MFIISYIKAIWQYKIIIMKSLRKHDDHRQPYKNHCKHSYKIKDCTMTSWQLWTDTLGKTNENPKFFSTIEMSVSRAPIESWDLYEYQKRHNSMIIKRIMGIMREWMLLLRKRITLEDFSLITNSQFNMNDSIINTKWQCWGKVMVRRKK